MEVLVIQPPSPSAVVLDQTGGRVSHVAPPWDATCLLSYIRQRTRHTGRIFDARVRAHWEADLAVNLTTKQSVNLIAVYCDRYAAETAIKVVTILRRVQPEAPVVGFGELPTLDPASFRARTGMDFGIAGDPEPTIRQLLDNFHIAFRRQRITGLIQDGEIAAAPLWIGDLKTLALPDWADVSLPQYDSRAYPGGSRVDVSISRGAAHAIDALERPGGAALRIAPMQRYIDLLQESAHLGISETHFTDPPDVWDTEHLGEWLDNLARVQNAQDWSLRLLALPIDESFRTRLIEQRCRRIELLVPSCDAAQAARLGYELPDMRELHHMCAAFQKSGVTVDVVFWAGGPGEPRGEASRIARFVRALRHAPHAVVARPGVPPGDPRPGEVARDVRRWLALSPGRRIAGLFRRIRSLHITIDEERRDLIVRPRGVPQAITGETDFHPLEKEEREVPNDWKD